MADIPTLIPTVTVTVTLPQTQAGTEATGSNEGALHSGLRLRVVGMMCGGCSAKVRLALAAVEGVTSVGVDLAGGVVELGGERPVLEAVLPEVQRALEGLGMESALASEPHLDGATPGHVKKQPIGPQVSRKALPLVQQVRKESVVRRFRCGCDCEDCICSSKRVVPGDEGCDVNLADLCARLEVHLSTFGDLSRVEATPEDLGFTEEVADVLGALDLPCPCESASAKRHAHDR